MVAYTVFPFKPSGVAPMFVSIERDDDASAQTEATNVLRDHVSATRVTLWRDDTVVFRGLSSACVAWLASDTRREAGCPALSASEGACPPNCRTEPLLTNGLG